MSRVSEHNSNVHELDQYSKSEHEQERDTFRPNAEHESEKPPPERESKFDPKKYDIPELN